MASQPIRRVMLDPSVFLDPDVRDARRSNYPDGLDLSDPAIREMIIVPRTFVDFVEGNLSEDLASSLSLDLEDFGDLTDVRPLLTDLPSFSHRFATFDIPSHEEVRVALLLEHGPIGAMYADEWAFLQSQSTLLSKVRRPLEAFRDAGAAIIEFGRKTGVQLIQQVIPKDHLPEALTARILATAAAKWIILGGATVGGGTLGGVAGTAIAGPPGAAWGSKAGGFAVGKAASAALLAIDPDAAVTPTARV